MINRHDFDFCMVENTVEVSLAESRGAPVWPAGQFSVASFVPSRADLVFSIHVDSAQQRKCHSDRLLVAHLLVLPFRLGLLPV